MRLVAPSGTALLLTLACHPGAPTPARPDQITQSAAECHFTMPDSSAIYAEKDTDDAAILIQAGTMRYPDDMRQSGQDGWVMVHYVVNSRGRAVPASIAIDSASNPAFIQPAFELLTGTFYRPAKIGDRPVAVCVKQKLNWVVR